jgi:hypothetical protein
MFPLHAPKNSFLSKVQRFKPSKDEMPGPGSYDVDATGKSRLMSKNASPTQSKPKFAVLKMQSPPSIPHKNMYF